MKDFPSCFGENGVQVADSASNTISRAAQNSVTWVYQCKLGDKFYLLNVIWSKDVLGQSLSVGIDGKTSQCLYKVETKPWVFSKKKGSKTLEADFYQLDVYWDLYSAKFGQGPEPLEGFYVGVVFEGKVILLLGDMRKEALKKASAVPPPSGAILVGKREHVYGKRVFSTKAKFFNNGRVRDVVIECDTSGINDPCLVIRVDNKQVMQVKQLRWKFRGNHTILVDGRGVEVLWDVHNWLFGSLPSEAVFLFETSNSSEKLQASQLFADPQTVQGSWSQRSRDSQLDNLGFSLILHAWKTE